MSDPTFKSGNAVLGALRHIESEMWDAIYAVEVLADRIRGHFERIPDGRMYQVHEDDGVVTNWCAGKTQDTLKRLMERFDEAFDAGKPPQRRAAPVDPIFAAFARMDAAAEALDRAAEDDGFKPGDGPAFSAWKDAAVSAAVTAPSTKAGLAMLLRRLAEDVERGPSDWQHPAVETAAAEVKKRLEGGAV